MIKNKSLYAIKVFLILIFIPIDVFSDDTAGSKAGFNEKTSNVLQQIEITGSITDESGEAMPGVNIRIDGTTTGVVTNIDGKFSIKVPNGQAVLLVTFVGYIEQRLPVGTQRNFSIVLKEDIQELGEIVVIGYGTQSKESVVGAISQVGNKALMQSGTASVTSAIAGKLSGVLTIQQSGQPGSNDSEIIIRGLSSWNGSEPLVLVDGVERDFKDLDPNEISTISTLKDASATAVFGARGANGVLIVTTKRGIKGKPKLDMSASYGMERATQLADHIDAYTTLSMYNVALRNQGRFDELYSDKILQEYQNPSSRLNSLRYPDTDWFSLLTKEFASTVNANVNVTGGTDFVRYFASLGYLYEGDLFKSADSDDFGTRFLDTSYKFHKLNYRANLDFSLTNTTTLSFNVGGDFSIQNHPKDSPWRNLYQASTTLYPAYFPSWALDEIPDPDYPDASGDRLSSSLNDYVGNPYSNFFQGNFKQYTESKLFTDLILDQKLDFITKGLSVKGKISLSTYYKMQTLYSDYSKPKYRLDFSKIGTGENPWYRDGQTVYTYIEPPIDLNVGGLESGYYTDLYYEFSVDYNHTFGNHGVSGLVLFNRQQKDKGTEFPYYNEAWVGRATYNYAHKYLLEVNMGYTGSERFAPENRFGFFPSGAVGWVISEENFFKNNIRWMNKLKLRYSDGVVGSDKAAERWLYQSSYVQDGAGKIREDKIANTHAKWETAHKRDLGIELGFLNNMFTLNVDFFDEQRKDMLLDPRTVTFLVGNSFKSLNLGKLKKHGIEIEADFNKTTSYGFNYHFKAIFGYNDNRIIYKNDLPYAPEYKRDEGKPLGAQLNGALLTGSGYYTSVDDIHNNPAPIPLTSVNVGDYKFLDYSADGVINNNDQFPIKGNLYPPITYSFGGGFSYKNFDFNILFQGNSGKWVQYNQMYETEFCKGTMRVHSSQLDYWTPYNQDVNHSTLHYYGTGDNPLLQWGGGEADKGYGLMLQDRYWRNADYLRIKEVYLAYTFRAESLQKLAGMSSLTVYATANNLYTFTSLIEGDPERKDFQQGFYPQMITLKLGVKVSF